MEGIDLDFCQDFARKEGQEFRSLEVRGKLIALKNQNKENLVFGQQLM